VEGTPLRRTTTRLLTCLALALVVLSGVVLARDHPAAASELIFNTQDFAPFNYEVNGLVAGPAADVIRRVCADMKIPCVMRLLPWRRAQQEVEEGKAHAMFVIGWNAERAKSLHFSPPLLNTEYGFFVREDNPLKFAQITDVKGYTVGVYGPSNTATALAKVKADVGDLAIDMTPDDESAFRKLSLGRVNAVFSNRDVGYDLTKRSRTSAMPAARRP
jgi:polar amino acid transport system substrate-binding protein